jgi:hypothetical protein
MDSVGMSATQCKPTPAAKQRMAGHTLSLSMHAPQLSPTKSIAMTHESGRKRNTQMTAMSAPMNRRTVLSDAGLLRRVDMLVTLFGAKSVPLSEAHPQRGACRRAGDVRRN